MSALKTSAYRLAISLVFLCFLPGLIGKYYPDTIHLSNYTIPLQLSLMSLLLFSHSPVQYRQIMMAFIAATVIYGLLILNQQGILLFGKMSYGTSLGPLWNGISLFSGLYWFVLLYCSCVMARVSGFQDLFSKSFVSAGALILCDFFMEPLAEKYGYWTWDKAFTPHQNYVAWYLIAFVLAFSIHSFKCIQTNKAAIAFYSAQFIYFLILNL